jgi:hypothetical protein
MMTEEQHEKEHAEIHKALFGDPESGEIGIVQMNREMYQAWSSLIWLIGKLTTLAVILGAIGTAWMAFGSGIKRVLQNMFGNHQ